MMKLYDEIIAKIQEMCMLPETKKLSYQDEKWNKVSDRSMILRSDTAYELGEGRLPAMGLTLITGNEELVKENGVFLLGEDLPEISSSKPYARVAIVRVKEETIGQGNALYNAIRKLEYTRYHSYPAGFMMRVSASLHRESVRIGKKELEMGLNFSKVGNVMLSDFSSNDLVEAVEIYYITEESFAFDYLSNLADEAENITKTIDHIFKNVIMDCKSCSLQEICDEVEGLKELHFGKQNEQNMEQS